MNYDNGLNMLPTGIWLYLTPKPVLTRNGINTLLHIARLLRANEIHLRLNVCDGHALQGVHVVIFTLAVWQYT